MSFHLYDINEIFTNADGTIQFIELKVGNSNGESFWTGHTITASQDGRTPITYTFTTDLPSTQTANTSVLLATQGFADLGIVTPNFIIPDGFLFQGNGSVNFSNVDQMNYTGLPTDGSHSLSRAGQQIVNSPTNFAGQTGSVVLATTNQINGTPGNDNLVGTAGADRIDAGAGRDQLNGGGGNDILNGDADLDAAVFSGNRSLYTVGGAAATVNGPDGNDVTSGVERLKFADMGLAFDFGANGAAANTAKLLGAVFGTDALHNRTYVGIGLSLFDNGSSYTEVADLAIHAALGVTAGTPVDNSALVRLLYTNVVGTAPDAATEQLFVGMITGGQFTQASITTFAADYVLNTEHIGLTGLAQTGIEYLPFPG